MLRSLYSRSKTFWWFTNKTTCFQFELNQTLWLPLCLTLVHALSFLCRCLRQKLWLPTVALGHQLGYVHPWAAAITLLCHSTGGGTPLPPRNSLFSWSCTSVLEKGLWLCDPKDCSWNPISYWKALETWGKELKNSRLRKPTNVPRPEAVTERAAHFAVLLQRLELPPGHGETHFPTSSLLDLEKGLEVRWSRSIVALPTKPDVSFCPLSTGGPWTE